MPDRKPILLVEDDALDAELALLAFAHHGLADQVKVVRDGQEALDYLHGGEAPRLVLLDLNMPRVNGHELLEQLRAHPVLQSLLVVVLSSSGLERELQRSHDLGAVLHALKPASFDAFTDLLGGLVGRYLAA